MSTIVYWYILKLFRISFFLFLIPAISRAVHTYNFSEYREQMVFDPPPANVPDSRRDVFYGSRWRADTINISLFVDGINVSMSSKAGAWPALGVVNNLPRKYRSVKCISRCPKFYCYINCFVHVCTLLSCKQSFLFLSFKVILFDNVVVLVGCYRFFAKVHAFSDSCNGT